RARTHDLRLEEQHREAVQAGQEQDQRVLQQHQLQGFEERHRNLQAFLEVFVGLYKLEKGF
ncbi:MAG: hypothetical protein QW286_03225, partial [Candidatus Aenigmatarchaeota archaeon]